MHGPFIPLHSSSRFIHNRSAVSFTSGRGRDLCVSPCVCGESTCRDVYFTYIVHINLFTQSRYGEELPSRDEVKVKGFFSARETLKDSLYCLSMCACAHNVSFENEMCDLQPHRWHTHVSQPEKVSTSGSHPNSGTPTHSGRVAESWSKK